MSNDEELDQITRDIGQCDDVAEWVKKTMVEMQARMATAAVKLLSDGGHPTTFMQQLAGEMRLFADELDAKAAKWIEAADVPQAEPS